MIERNTSGLKDSAERKRQKSFEKLELGIQELIKNRLPINFKSVSEASGLSRSWLYKEPEVKARIEQLRAQTEKTNKTSPKQKASADSKDALINTLKLRLKKVNAENDGLKKQLEVVYGQMSYGKEQEQKIKRLEAENTRLKDKLYAPVSNDLSKVKVIADKRSEISERIKSELLALNIKLNSTLSKKIKARSEEVVLTAIEALKQAMDNEVVRQPGAWLGKAITDAWKPNEARGGFKPKDTFEEWYDLARDYGIVKRCEQREDGWCVQENTGQWHSHQEFSQKWTLEYLKKVSSLKG